VRLEDVVEALDMPEDWEVFLDPETGEIIAVTEEERFSLEAEEQDPDDLPDWEEDALAQARRAMASERMLQLPDRFEVHEWDLMRQFAESRAPSESAELRDAIHGSGAFRMFRSTVDRLGLREAWYGFRGAAFERNAKEWLRGHGIAFVEGTPPRQAGGRPVRLDFFVVPESDGACVTGS
jgi:hypothetical protein